MTPRLKRTIVDIAIMAATVAAALAVGRYAPDMYETWKGKNRSGDFSEHIAGLPAKITLYGTTTCPACIKARAYLDKSGIAFNDRILGESSGAEHLYARLGQSSVPILVSKDKFVIGFNETEYQDLARAGSVNN